MIKKWKDKSLGRRLVNEILQLLAMLRFIADFKRLALAVS
jgi:hypothetical protein